MKKSVVKRMCFDAVFASLSIVLYVIGPKFPIAGLFPSFLEINFSLLPILITTFVLGPIDGLIVSLIRFVVKLPMTSTMYVGEISDLMMSIVIVICTGLFNMYFKTQEEEEYLVNYKHRYKVIKHKNIIMFGIIVLSWIIGGLISNSFCLPMYCAMYSTNAVKGMIKIFPWVNDSNWVLYYFTLAVIPFNIIISVIVGIVTLSVNKGLKSVYKKI